MEATDVVPRTDFTAVAKDTDLNPGVDVATHFFKVTKYISYSDSSQPGTILYHLPIDSHIDPVAPNIATAYERYSIKDLKVHIQATSPFGTSSGGMQVAFFPDPQNATFEDVGDDGSIKNVMKLVRQSGSMLVRPRESAILPCFTDGTLYTLRTGDPRFWSFGSIVFLMRTAPDAGDKVSFTVTVSGAAHFMRTAVIDEDQLSKEILAFPSEMKTLDNNLALRFSKLKLPKTFSAVFTPPLKAKLTTNKGNEIYIRSEKIAKMNYVRDTKDSFLYNIVLQDLNKYGRIHKIVFQPLAEYPVVKISPRQ